MNKGFTLIEFVVVVAIIILVCLTVFGSFLYIPISTGFGQHTGYVTAVERNGLFFKKWKAYVKTDPQSSQEDAYCVIDPNVVTELQTAADSKENVTLGYYSVLSTGVKCEDEDAIINSVTPVK